MARRTQRDPSIGERIRIRRELREYSIRFAASKAGIADSTWSRIERGLMSADNRFILAAVAEALECSMASLTRVSAPPDDRQTQAAQASVYSVRRALVDVDVDQPDLVTPRPTPELERETALLRDLRTRCEFAGVGRLAPGLLRELHAASHGPDRETALRLMVDACQDTATMLRCLGHPAEAWVAAQRCREAAETLHDPVLVTLAAFVKALAVNLCGSYQRVLTMATRSIDAIQPHLAKPGAMEMLGNMYEVAASGSTGTKRPDDAAAWLDEAADVAGRTGETSTFGLMFGPTDVRFWRVMLDADGDAGRAVVIANATNPAVIGSTLRESQFHLDTGRALARIRQEEKATRHLLVAERLAPQRVHADALVRETARSLLVSPRRNAAAAELRGLCERLGIA